MAKKITDTQLKEYLAKVRKPQLITWLLEQCENNPELRASLLDFATPKEDARVLAPEIRSRIRQAWKLSAGRNGWKSALPIGQQLEQALISIEGLIEKGCTAEAEQLLADFVAAAEKGMEQVDDSYGHLWPVCQHGVTLWGNVWAKIVDRDINQLAELVYEHIRDNGYAIKDDMIAKFADALGPDGLHLLQWHLRRDLAAIPKADTNDRGHSIDHDRFEIVCWLKEIADILGDVDDYIAIVESEQDMGTYALAVSRRLFEAGRAEEAFVYLERAKSRHLQSEPYDYPSLKSKILIALGKSGQAREVLWQEFARNLSTYALEEILELTPKEEKAAAHQRAIKLAQTHPSPVQAAHFLVEIKEPKLAAELIDKHQDEISGSCYDILKTVAKALAGSYPAQAWIIYRALLLDILEEGRYKAYGHAARYFNQMQDLAKQADIASRHADFEQTLRQNHGRKSSFWAKIEAKR
ncbi:MAG: hypothetical protein IH624_13825 [Phycisphaerae bacterium]|nr:hypothetical protein [Phycisphaerae bacterium]